LAAAWFTVRVWPAIVAVYPTGVFKAFTGMVTETLPLPVPPAGVAPKPDAVHGQPARDDKTLTERGPPAAGSLTLDGLMANVQTDPNWVIA
jgi:hypothetical protein